MSSLEITANVSKKIDQGVEILGLDKTNLCFRDDTHPCTGVAAFPLLRHLA
jgi:hypothetical protein